MSTGKEPWNDEVRGEQVLPLINMDCPVMRVPAGPGTGKTFGLKRRVVRLLHPDGLGVDPSIVLVCTYNRVIAEDLKAEIESELSIYGIDPPAVRTVHALAASLGNVRPRLLLPQEQEAMIFDVRYAHPNIDAEFAKRQSKAMRALKEHEAGLKDHPALAGAVRKWLTDHGASLVGDLPREVATRIENGDFGDRRYEHIIIDEFQDLADVEIRLLLALRSENSQLVALGDRKQSIYAFRGNEKKGLEGLTDLLDVEIVDHKMDECQRCPAAIVNLANDVMAVYGEPLAVASDLEGKIYQVHSKTPSSESTCLAEEIVRVFKARPDEKHLVMITRRKWGYDLRNRIRGIDPDLPVQTVFAEDVLETWPAREAFILLSIAGDNKDAASLRDWIAYKAPDRTGKNWKAQSRNARAYASIVERYGVLNLEKALTLAELEESELAGAGRRNVLQRLVRLKALISDLPQSTEPQMVVNHIFDPEKWVTSQTASQDLARDDLERLHREATKILTDRPSTTLEQLVGQLRYRIATRQPLGVEASPGVKIVTLWGAKGLTADFVYLLGLCDEALPGPFDEESTGLTLGEYELEQRRLLYVSLTRAKKALVISRPLKIRRGEVKGLRLITHKGGYGNWQELQQSRFLADVPPAHLPRSVDGDVWQGIDLSRL